MPRVSRRVVNTRARSAARSGGVKSVYIDSDSGWDNVLAGVNVGLFDGLASTKKGLHETMISIYNANNPGGGPDWEELSERWKKFKKRDEGNQDVMNWTETMLGIVLEGAAEKTTPGALTSGFNEKVGLGQLVQSKGLGFMLEFSWPDIQHPRAHQTGYDTIPEIALAHELGFTVGTTHVKPRPWLTLAADEISSEIQPRIGAALGASLALKRTISRARAVAKGGLVQ